MKTKERAAREYCKEKRMPDMSEKWYIGDIDKAFIAGVEWAKEEAIKLVKHKKPIYGWSLYPKLFQSIGEDEVKDE